MTNEIKKVLVSGVKPTARLHIGNYFGAVKQFVDMQSDYDSRIFIADYHALTTIHDPKKLSQLIYDTAVDYLAIGLDPEKTRIYKQSDVPNHTELSLILSNIVPSSYLSRAHAYKDAKEKNKDISAGTVYYPILMSSDILMYDAEVVPVGKDQKQHVEYARDFAERFNRIYGETFTHPEAYIIENVQTVTGLDGRKMSKSYDNTIPLFAEDKEIERLIMGVPTDSTAPEEPKKNYQKDILFKFHELFTKDDEFGKVKEGYEKGGLTYKESKEILVKNISNFMKPLREKRLEIINDKEYVMSVLSDGAEKSRKEADQKMGVVRRRVGLTPDNSNL